jgi:hypothetical protein
MPRRQRRHIRHRRRIEVFQQVGKRLEIARIGPERVYRQSPLDPQHVQIALDRRQQL